MFAAGLPKGPNPAGIARAEDGATAVDLLMGELLASGHRDLAAHVGCARFHHCPTKLGVSPQPTPSRHGRKHMRCHTQCVCLSACMGAFSQLGLTAQMQPDSWCPATQQDALEPASGSSQGHEGNILIYACAGAGLRRLGGVQAEPDGLPSTVDAIAHEQSSEHSSSAHLGGPRRCFHIFHIPHPPASRARAIPTI